MRKNFCHHRRRRRGAIYLVVLATASLVALLGLSAVIAARLRLHTVGPNGDALEAQLYAQSATELGRLWISQDANWRTDRSTGYWANKSPIGKGSFSVYVYDPANVGGALNDTTSDPVIFIGTGYCGNASQQVQVQLNRYDPPLTCLNTAATANGLVTFNSGLTLTSSGTVAGNGTVTASGATINAPVEAVVAATGTTYTPAPTTVVHPRTMPDPTNVFSYYTTNGTPISIGSIGQVSGVTNLSGQVLSSGVNPYGGALNASGIYVVDCQEQQINIKNCRIVGTLVLLNVGAGSIVQQNCLFQTGPTKLPVLMVQGAISITTTSGTFSESSIAANLNPPGAPYNGVTNTTTTDSYPTEFQGLVYVSGNLTTQNHPVFKAPLVIGGTWSATGAVDLTPDASYYQSPPSGFTAPTQMIVAPASWQ